MPNDYKATAESAAICRTCGHALTTQEREDYVDQCGPCVSSPPAVPAGGFCGDTGLVPWMSESDPHMYQEADADGQIPCPDCAPSGNRSTPGTRSDS